MFKDNPLLAALSATPIVETLWAVQYKTNPEKGGSPYWLVSPSTWPTLPPQAIIVAWTKSENDARRIAQALNDADTQQDESESRPWEAEGGESKSYRYIEYETKKLAGQVLTILDAAFVNEQQNKAVKTLVKQAFRAKLTEIWKKCFTDDARCDEESGGDRKDPLGD